MYPSYSAIKKYKQQLADQIKGLETDLDKTASTVREMEVGIYGNRTIGSPCPWGGGEPGLVIMLFFCFSEKITNVSWNS